VDPAPIRPGPGSSSARSVAAQIGTNPRIIADDIWAKLLWAGLNLQAGDLPGTSAGSYYPVELVRALSLTWLFAGLRSDEISRLRVGCIRWQHNGQPIRGDARDVLAEDAVCLLDVPVHKTGTAFTKPVDPIVGQAIDAWQTLRPTQPQRPDRKTGEPVDLLFSIHRAADLPQGRQPGPEHAPVLAGLRRQLPDPELTRSCGSRRGRPRRNRRSLRDVTTSGSGRHGASVTGGGHVSSRCRLCPHSTSLRDAMRHRPYG
jgi:integrase